MKKILFTLISIFLCSFCYGQDQSDNNSKGVDNFVGAWHQINATDTIIITKNSYNYHLVQNGKSVSLNYKNDVLQSDDPTTGKAIFNPMSGHIFWQKKEYEIFIQTASANQIMPEPSKEEAEQALIGMLNNEKMPVTYQQDQYTFENCYIKECSIENGIMTIESSLTVNDIKQTQTCTFPISAVNTVSFPQTNLLVIMLNCDDCSDLTISSKAAIGKTKTKRHNNFASAYCQSDADGNSGEQLERAFLQLKKIYANHISSSSNNANVTQAQVVNQNLSPGEFFFTNGDTYNYGIVSEGPSAECDFEFTNNGQSPITISEAHGSCGCVHVDWPKGQIMPGTKNNIHVTYLTTGRPGPIVKEVTITSDASQQKTILHIRGNVGQ